MFTVPTQRVGQGVERIAKAEESDGTQKRARLNLYVCHFTVFYC